MEKKAKQAQAKDRAKVCLHVFNFTPSVIECGVHDDVEIKFKSFQARHKVCFHPLYSMNGIFGAHQNNLLGKRKPKRGIKRSPSDPRLS